MELLLNKEVDLLIEWFYDTYKDYKLDVLYEYKITKRREEMMVQVSRADRKAVAALPLYITDVMKLDQRYCALTQRMFFPNMRKAISKVIADDQFKR